MTYEHENEHRYDDWLESLYEEHKPRALDEFTSGRLQSYFLANPAISAPAVAFLREARELGSSHPTAAFILAAAAVEVVIKAVLLKPVVYGLVHSESTAGLITDLLMKHNGLDRYKDLLFGVLNVHAKVDLRTYKRAGESRCLWNEIQDLQGIRNAAVHQAKSCTHEDAQRAIRCGTALIDHIFPSVLDALGLHLHEGTRVCGDYQCRVKRELAELRSGRYPLPQ